MYYAVYVEADRIFGMGAWYGIFSKKGLLLKNVFVFKCRLVLTSIMLSPVQIWDNFNFDYYDFMTRGFDDITLMFYETKP